jgi:hypothetical protein
MCLAAHQASGSTRALMSAVGQVSLVSELPQCQGKLQAAAKCLPSSPTRPSGAAVLRYMHPELNTLPDAVTLHEVGHPPDRSHAPMAVSFRDRDRSTHKTPRSRIFARGRTTSDPLCSMCRVQRSARRSTNGSRGLSGDRGAKSKPAARGRRWSLFLGRASCTRRGDLSEGRLAAPCIHRVCERPRVVVERRGGV